MNSDDMKRELRLFLSRELKHGAPVADDEPLLELNFDSRAMTEFVFFAEAIFGVIIDPDELDEDDHFEDVNALVALLERKQSQD